MIKLTYCCVCKTSVKVKCQWDKLKVDNFLQLCLSNTLASINCSVFFLASITETDEMKAQISQEG